METEIQQLKARIVELETELDSVKEQLKKFTAPSRSKLYYENHKEEIKKRNQEYREKSGYKPSPEAVKERNKKAYLKRKEKLLAEKNANIISE
jgi:hypothetical protein